MSRTTRWVGGTARRRLPPAVLLALLGACASAPGAAERAVAAAEVRGPEHGALVIAGGGRLGPEVWARFLELAGGPTAPIVVIPTAGGDSTYGPRWAGLEALRAAGARNLTVLHTYDPAVADTEEFVAPLRQARAVWIPGGRQWRLADAYLDTRTHRELRALLDRGGVVGGTSAGASIMASYLVRGAPQGNHIMMSPGHERGFGFLPNTAIDQHLLARNRQRDLLQVLAVHPQLLGIGIDEGTAVVVQGDRFEVVGDSRVAVYDAAGRDGEADFYYLHPGAVYNLRARRVERGNPVPSMQDEPAAAATR